MPLRRYSTRASMIWILLASLILTLVLRTWVLSSAVVVGQSMEPSLPPGCICLIQKWSTRRQAPALGELVVINHPEVPGTFIKRVIARGGDTITFEYPRIRLNGELLEEPYLIPDEITTSGKLDPGSYPVPEGHVFVMGDNRNASEDSRYLGMISTAWIVGRAVPVFR